MPKDTKVFVASSNEGKLREFRALAAGQHGLQLELALLPGFGSMAAFPEDQPTFAENALGKALHYSRSCQELVIADDSGLVAPALGGEPGVRSARYAGPQATSAERNAKLLAEMREVAKEKRGAYFVCAMALARAGRPLAVVTARVDGTILESPRGSGGFGYDPVFYLPEEGKSMAEISAEEKNELSHRGRAFRKILAFLAED